jgi:hypothetical protein
MSHLQKQNAKKTQKMQNVPKTPEILGFLSKIGCGDLSKHWKSVENDTESPAHLCTFFSEILRLGSLQLRIEVKFRKKAFSTFFEIFNFFLRFTGWRSTVLHGAKIWTLFRKVRNTFSVLGPILCCFTRENPSGRKWRRLQITPIGPLLRRGQFYAFVQIPGCEMASKKSERFCSTII